VVSAALPPELHAADFCYLSTTGRRTGRTHTIEIWFGARDDGHRFYCLAGGGDRADWVRNLVASSAVEVAVGDRRWRAEATVVDDASERTEAAALVFDKYQPGYGGDLSSWRDSALPVAVDLVGPLGPTD
jgi:deazaflavin-dependent oxidoreductase (nitroreductase family)